LHKQAVKGDKEARTWLQLIVQGILKQAARGDVRAFAEIADRLESQTVQAHEVAGPQGGVIPLTIASPEENERRIAELLADFRLWKLDPPNVQSRFMPGTISETIFL